MTIAELLREFHREWMRTLATRWRVTYGPSTTAPVAPALGGHDDHEGKEAGGLRMLGAPERQP